MRYLGLRNETSEILTYNFFLRVSYLLSSRSLEQKRREKSGQGEGKCARKNLGRVMEERQIVFTGQVVRYLEESPVCINDLTMIF